jgi:hypothetical protein
MTFRLRFRSRHVSFLFCFGVLAITRAAAAQDAPPALLATPASYTDVADAFEEGNPIDVNVRLGYRHEVTSGTIQREVVDASSQDGRSSHHQVNVADYTRIQNELALRLEVGVYHDLMVFMGLPIVLSDDRELRGSGGNCGGTGEGPGCLALREPAATASTPAQPLFDLSTPQQSARRSGVPSIDFGVAWAVTNQYRLPNTATWVLIAQASADTGTVMRPCLEGQSCEPGVSRGTTRFTLESRWSYRYRHVEPYFGVSHTFEWAHSGTDQFRPTGGLAGVVDDGLPSVTAITLGAAIIPWEDRVRWQRLEIDVRGAAAFNSAGLDYSPLFDALGTSKNPYLSLANTVVGGDGNVRFTGITNVEAYARLGLDTAVVVRAARYVRFVLGGGFAYLTSHRITGAPACDTSVTPSAVDSRVGDCDSGIVNPVYRPAIDAPGKRFQLDGAVALHFQLSASAMF